MSRKTDLLAVMSAARPEQLEPPADPRRLERFRTAAVSGAAPRRQPRGNRTGGRFGRPAGYGPAIAVAAALLAGLVIVTSPADPKPTQLSAQQTLLAAATALGADSTATGRYWTADLSTHTTVSYAGDTAAGPPPPTAAPLYRYSSTCDARLWGARSSRDTSWLIIGSVTNRRLTNADEQAWRRAGSPGNTGCQLYQTSIGMRSSPPAALRLPRSVPTDAPEGPSYPTIAGLPVSLDQITALPTDPTALKATLDDLWATSIKSMQSTPGAPGSPTPGQTVPTSITVQVIADLLITAPTPPATQAALYRVLAGLPINRSRGTVTDQLGRHGVAFWAPVGATDQKLIIDPQTGHPLAVENYTAGELDTYTLVRHQGWTDTLPDLPANRL
jgi:hypothetical protein